MFEDDLGISGLKYQKRAKACIQTYLNSFSPSSKSYELKTTRTHEIPISILVHENPPSVQIRQSPQGGKSAGLSRIQEQLSLPADTETVGELIIPKTKILMAQEHDLTRECIILTLRDSAANAIVENGLISPKCVAAMLHELKKGHPDFFIVVQRYLIGIEQTDGYKVPYSIVNEKDERAFEYLETLVTLS